MALIFQLLLLTLGLGALIKGADYFVEGASSLAHRLSISPMIIGLTVVAFGTSTPELVVNIFAVLRGEVNLTYGNIIGSNIHNILLILGISGIIHPLSTQRNTVWREIPFALIAVIAVIVLSNDTILSNSPDQLSRGDGIILLLFFAIFLTYVFGMTQTQLQDEYKITEMTLVRILAYIGIGLIGLILGSRLVVVNGVEIAQTLGISERVIGLTVIAVGTSLPELTTSAMAAYRGESDIAIGNIVGSNIFNIFLVLGISSLIAPLPFSTILNLDFGMMLLATTLLFTIMFMGKTRVIGRAKGGLFLVLWITYMGYLILQ
ncbi:MAG: calcium/sodium antiporter [Candidatus Marinimicrobia bacterium]|nr:calcium/sodium antiporter [FCB group bacterium]MBL7023948.1 calcium/sodium antiporter [Candidatus Neomarinimicrobiota bacterium]